METSILTSIKKMVGIQSTVDHFDADVIIHINSALRRLKQLGVGKADTRMIIADDSTNWLDLFDDDEIVSSAKVYIYMRVKLIFDPPESSFATTALKEEIEEYEWTLNVDAETIEEET